MTFENASQWETWLAKHHSQAPEIWIKIAKKNSGKPSVTITEALDTALCYGWIDSHRRSYDKDHYLQRYSPRRPKSAWSQININKANALIAAGRMQEAGFAAIQTAKDNGKWNPAHKHHCW